MPAAAIPIIMAVSATAGTAYSIYAANKQQKTLESQYAQARQDQQNLQAKQEEQGQTQLNQAKPGLNQALGYYSTLLGGNRAQMRNVTAAPRAAITEQYRGAEHGLEKAGLRGGALDTAKEELARDRVGKVAGLTTGVQPMAAEALGNLTSGLMGNVNGAFGNAGMTGANLLNADARQLSEQRNADSRSMSSWGGLVSGLLSGYGGNKNYGVQPAGYTPSSSYATMPKTGPMEGWD